MNALSRAQAGSGISASLDLSQLSQTQTNVSDLSKQIQTLIKSEDLLSNVRQLSDAKIGSTDTYHYSVTISKQELEDLFSKIILLETQSALTQNMAQAIAKTFIDSMGDINMELWIGKKDYLL